MKLVINIEAEVQQEETVESIRAILENTLPYMADNVLIRSDVEED